MRSCFQELFFGEHKAAIGSAHAASSTHRIANEWATNIFRCQSTSDGRQSHIAEPGAGRSGQKALTAELCAGATQKLLPRLFQGVPGFMRLRTEANGPVAGLPSLPHVC